MKPSDRRKQLKSDMAARQSESYSRKDDSGKFKSIFSKEAIAGISMWKCSEDEHFLNVIPFIAGANNPNVKAGAWAFNLDFFVHRKVGVNEDSYICLSRTFNKPCPICEYQAELRKQDDYDEALVKSFNPTRRVLYNVECLDSEKESSKGVQLFEVSHWLFQKELDELSKKPKGGGFVLFADPDEGKTVFFRKKGSGATNTEYKAFKFEDRDAPISDSILDGAYCLDELIHIPTYSEVKSALFGSDTDESETTPKHKEEVAQEATESRRTRRETAPEPKKAAFVCPGTSPVDFGEFDACDTCQDASKCETDYIANQRALEEEKEEVVEKEVEATARRRRPEAAVETVKEEPAEEPAEEPTRRTRRRPGQD